MIRNYLNYIGSKDRYMPLINKFLEETRRQGSKTLVDLFCGSAVVGVNELPHFDYVICNDKCEEIIALHTWVQENSIESLLQSIDDCIAQYDLSKTNKDGFLELREHYNSGRSQAINPVELFCLITHSFNYSLHTNKDGQYNVPFGANKSSFNKSLREKLIQYKAQLEKHPNKLTFSNEAFEYWVNQKSDNKVTYFVDPPYSTSISKHPYRVGNIKWTEQQDRDLLNSLKKLSDEGNYFVLTNVYENNGLVNNLLQDWVKKEGFTCYEVTSVDYANCSYQRKNNGTTKEVIITNLKNLRFLKQEGVDKLYNIVYDNTGERDSV